VVRYEQKQREKHGFEEQESHLDLFCFSIIRKSVERKRSGVKKKLSQTSVYIMYEREGAREVEGGALSGEGFTWNVSHYYKKNILFDF
jgi:hypothetical protein